MDSISLSKRWTSVIALVFTCAISVASLAKDKKTITVEDPVAAAINAKAAKEKELREAAKKSISECETAKEKAQKEKGIFAIACQEGKKKMRKLSGNNTGTEGINESKEAIEKCSKEFDECLEEGDDELDLSGVLGAGSAGAAADIFQGALNSAAGSAKRCSDMNKGDYRTALDKAETALDTKTKNLEDIQDKMLKSQEEAQENYEKLQKEFVEEQKKKTKADLDKKENDRNQQAAYDKQRAEYKAKADAINIEIFQLQQSISLLLRSKGEEVNTFNLELIGCQEMAQKKKDERKGTSSGLMAAGQTSAAKKVWQICVGNAARKRAQAAEVYSSKMKQLEMSIQMKSKELAALEESAGQLAAMFQEAKADQAKQKDDEDQAFLEQQKQSWLAMQNRLQGMQNKNFKNQQTLENANRQLNIASKHVEKLKGEKPISSKSPEELEQALNNFNGYISSAKVICDQAEAANKEYQDFQKGTK